MKMRINAGQVSRLSPNFGKSEIGWKPVLFWLALLTVNLQLSTVFAQGTAFTYQGRLLAGGQPANGTNYSMVFYLYDAPTNGNLLGNLGIASVTVSNGLFTVPLDFGSTFDGNPRWLEVSVEKTGPGGDSGFTPLFPLQQITPAPYAIYAENAGNLGGPLPASQLTSIGNTNVGATGNFFVGPSGNSTTSGNNNTANGVLALLFNTTGSDNTASGGGALFSNTSGNDNTANGVYALLYNTNGSNNTADGVQALYSNTNGNNNTANGVNALYFNTTGSLNTANGVLALLFNTTGSQNTADGVNALYSNKSGSGNIALGFGAGYYATNNDNIEIGNEGLPTDNNLIRIGTAQTDTYLTGIIHGNSDATFAGKVGIGTSSPTNALDVNGNIDARGNVYANGVLLTSDRNAKENFASVDPEKVLDKVAALPMSEWNYKTDAVNQKHLGPMAQDFHAAFGLNGSDDKHISVIDEGGVALAAIQGLNEKLEARSEKLEAENAELKAQLTELKVLVKQLAGERQ